MSLRCPHFPLCTHSLHKIIHHFWGNTRSSTVGLYLLPMVLEQSTMLLNTDFLFRAASFAICSLTHSLIFTVCVVNSVFTCSSFIRTVAKLAEGSPQKWAPHSRQRTLSKTNSITGREEKGGLGLINPEMFSYLQWKSEKFLHLLDLPDDPMNSACCYNT